MNYELAQRLRDADFPQNAVAGDWFYNEWKAEDLITANEEGLTLDKYVKKPTLSELIEECKEQGLMLYYENPSWRVELRFRDNNFTFRALTPEEAVAKLWLALNTKQ